jgi:hypothetical protein
MLKTITKDIYNISYNITDTILTISVKNNENFKKYSSVKTIDEYCVYTDIGLDIFDIVNNSLNTYTFNIVDNDSNITITFTNGKLKIPIKCDFVKDDDESVGSQLNLNKITRELNEYKKTLALLTTKFEEQQKYIDDVIKPLSTYVYINNQRINKYKKHLVISSPNGLRLFTEVCKRLETFKDCPYVQNCYCSYVEDFKVFYNRHYQEAMYYDILDVPQIIQTRCELNIEELINIESETLVLANMTIRNFELLRHFKGKKMYILDCHIFNLPQGQNEVQKQVPLLKSFSSQLVNLTELTIMHNLEQKFNNDFFKQFKSLKTFITKKGNMVCCNSDDIVIEYVDYRF